MRRQRLFVRLALRLIAAYQMQSARAAPMCSYDESCSSYAMRRLRERGLVRGGIDAYRRYRTCTAAEAVRRSAGAAP